MVLEVKANFTEILSRNDRWLLVQVGSPHRMYTLMPFKIMWRAKVER
jgi:hypothetical protein